MARMIPAYCAEAAPPGEKAVFAALRDAPDTADWTVMHSLGIARHKQQVEGEADFVIIAPGLGLVVIEVKSHRSVSRGEDGMWRLGRDEPTLRGPFQQAQEAMYSIRSHLQRQNVSLRDVPTLYAAWFTHVRARAELSNSLEWHSWQILDSQDLSGAAHAVRRVFTEGLQHLESRINGFGNRGVGLDQRGSDRIVSTLRSKFELVLTHGDRRQARESDLAKFIEEQYRALDYAADNRRVLFTGHAGTGKTFLAVEAAQREVAQGRTGRLLCFNNMLGSNLREKLSGIGGLRVGTLHQEMLRLAGINGPPFEADEVFWEKELPDRALEGLVERGEQEIGDFLVIDEVQDIANPLYFGLLDLLVKDGLRRGRVFMFGDFEHQTIYGGKYARNVLETYSPDMPSFRLSENCRNLPRIGYQVNLLSRMDPGFTTFRRPDDGVDPTVIKYGRGDAQDMLLKRSVRNLRDEGFDLTEIVVLSPRGNTSVASTTSDSWLRQILRKDDGSKPVKGCVRYSTIHSFKGMDAPAIIVTDLDDTGTPNIDALTYVGLTRATDRLVVMVESSTLMRLLGGGV